MEWGDKITDKVLHMVLYHMHRNGIEKKKKLVVRLDRVRRPVLYCNAILHRV